MINMRTDSTIIDKFITLLMVLCRFIIISVRQGQLAPAISLAPIDSTHARPAGHLDVSLCFKQQRRDMIYASTLLYLIKLKMIKI